MAQRPRLNKVIELLEQGKVVFGPFAAWGSVEAAIEMANSQYDFVVFEGEHGAFSTTGLRDSLQFMLNRRQLVEGGSLQPAVVPFARIPPNGRDANQWVVKQVLDQGAYGIVWPHINTVQEARAAVQACRYPQVKGAADFEPAGQRGAAPGTAVRYWGVSSAEYFERADLWPLDPNGELLLIIMIEEMEGVRNLPAILREVPGIGAVLVGEGDLTLSLGFPGGAPVPEVQDTVQEVLAICKEHNVVCASPQTNAANIEKRIADGFRLLMPGAPRSYATLERGLQLAGRA